MSNHIIIDGPDAVGKTTLAKYINSKFGYEILHNDQDCPNTYEYFHNLLMEDSPLVLDRFIAGEYVYPKIYGREPKISITEMTNICNDIMASDSLYIIMNTGNLDVLNSRLIERNEMNYLDEIKSQVNEFTVFAGHIFEDYFENFAHPNEHFIYVDISKPDAYDKLYNTVLEFIQARAGA